MTKYRSHSAAFKRQVAEKFIAGETLHGLSQRHDISRQLIRIWVGKFEAGADRVPGRGVATALLSRAGCPFRLPRTVG